MSLNKFYQSTLPYNSESDYKLIRKRLLLTVEYCFCFFMLLVLPIIQTFYVTSGYIRYFSIGYFIASILIFNITRKNIFKKHSQISILIVSIILLTILFQLFISSYATASESNLSFFNLTYNLYIQHTRFLLSSLMFIYYSYEISKIDLVGYRIENYFYKSRLIKNIFQYSVLMFSFLIILYSLLFVEFNQGSIVSSSRLEIGGYSGYIATGDLIFFLSLSILLLLQNNFISIFTSIILTYISFLIGSRPPAILASLNIMIVILICLFEIFRHLHRTNFFKKIKILTKNLGHFFIGIFVIILLLNLFSLNIYSTDLFNLDNFYDSRVYRSVFLNQEDSSLDDRKKYFQCFLDSYSANTVPFEQWLYGTPNLAGCSGYVHSALSIFVDLGIVGFSIYLGIIYLTLKAVIKSSKSFRLQLITTLFLALLLSFFARAGAGIILTFCGFIYSFSFYNENFVNLQSKSFNSLKSN
jgi:hypothetical protein